MLGISRVYAYADDLAVIALGRTSCGKIIDIVNKWADDNGMKLNNNKT